MVTNKVTVNKVLNYCNFFLGCQLVFLNVLVVRITTTDGFSIDHTDLSSKIPQFTNAYPINKTMTKGSQAVFQSRVYSEEYPNIKWFRRLSDSTNYGKYARIHSTVYSKGRPYELLPSSREKSTTKNIYLSKLIINDVNLQDEGFYACVAMSIHGHNIREAYLKVYTPDADDLTEYWSDYKEEDNIFLTDPKDFWLLILMPAGLSLLPLCVWVCYIVDKRCRNCSLKNDEPKKIFQENT